MLRTLALFAALCLPTQVLAQKTVYLKLDDLTAYPPRLAAFLRAEALLASKGVRVSFGLIGNALQDPTLVRRTALCAALPKFGTHVELFHHGFDHAGYTDGTYEFSGTSEEFQREHLDAALTLAQGCGVDIRVFNAPFNLTDFNTVRALENVPQLTHWTFPSVTTGTTKTLHRTQDTRVDMEPTTGTVDYCYFLEKYALAGGKSSIVVQGHPGAWTEASWVAFGRIVDLLKATGAKFKTLGE